MWQAETKPFTHNKLWLGNGSVNTTEATINVVAGIELSEGLTIQADSTNNDIVIVKWTGNGGGAGFRLLAGKDVHLPVTNPSSINVVASANTVNYSFIAW